MKKYIINSIVIVSIVLISTFTSCSSNDCEYVTIEDITGSDLCQTKSILNISTGIDELGNVIAPGDNVADPYWRLINRPLFNQSSVSFSDQQLINTINGNAFVVNYNNSNSTQWINQNNSSSISPLNAGTTQVLNGSVTVTNDVGQYTPYIFERSFCVKKNNVNLTIDIEARGAVRVNFELVDNINNVILATSQDITTLSDTWYDVINIPSAGSYSIRAFLIYKDIALPAFSLVGNIKTTDNSLVLTNNKNNCCSNNIIGLTIINDGINGNPGIDNCNGAFDSNIDEVFNLIISASIIDPSGQVLTTINVDEYGNIIFAGLPDGTYTIQLIVPDTIAYISPNNFNVTVANNEVKNFNIFVCL